MASDSDFKAHQDTFNGVMVMIKWGAAATVLITALVIFLIAR